MDVATIATLTYNNRYPYIAITSYTTSHAAESVLLSSTQDRYVAHLKRFEEIDNEGDDDVARDILKAFSKHGETVSCGIRKLAFSHEGVSKLTTSSIHLTSLPI